MCAKCGLAKGAPGCCKMSKGDDKPTYLCTKCGHFKGSAKCCKGAMEQCSCGLAKGSPGCCKIKKVG